MAEAVPVSITNLYSGALRAAPRELPDDRFEPAHAPNGILTFTPGGGDDPNNIPSDLLLHNGAYHARRGRPRVDGLVRLLISFRFCKKIGTLGQVLEQGRYYCVRI